MPNYFFHVTIELVAGDTRRSPSPEQSPASGPFLNALKPFIPPPTSTPSVSLRALQSRPDHSSFTAMTAAPHASLAHSPPGDQRQDSIMVEGTDMSTGNGDAGGKEEHIIEKGLGTAISGHHLKGRYEPLQTTESAQGWGIVHLYRDAEETAGLCKDSVLSSADIWSDGLRNPPSGKPHPPPRDEDCSSLCILAVPSYMTPSDFLSFVGEATRSDVSHFRMVRTARANRYMVLMKFRSGRRARDWQNEWNGKVFNSMEPETCHVVFLKSVELIQTSGTPADSDLGDQTTISYPRMSNDPFTPAAAAAATAKPPAPRTPALVELPTCPVCLERMDETTGLLTIPCQHVFHCTCLEKWSGGGCPVCRYTHDDFSSHLLAFKSKAKGADEYDAKDRPLECEVCHVDTSLWQCLICGKVGCGRYEGKHAYAHFEESGHAFSMDLESKRVWDYAGDAYVHRIIQETANPGEKLVELPGRRREPTALQGQEDMEVAKMDTIALEYTHLLTSQLESQRVYFEEVVERAVDKAAEASKKAEQAAEDARVARDQLRRIADEHELAVTRRLPELEREKSRLERRGVKLEEMSRGLGQKYQEEKTVSTSLMERLTFLETSQAAELAQLRDTIRQLEEDSATKDLLMEGLRDEHRDAMMQISAQNQLQAMIANGELDPQDLEGAVIEAGPAAKKPAARKPPKGRGGASRQEPKAADSSRPDTHGEITKEDIDLYRALFGDGNRLAVRDDTRVRPLLQEFQRKLLDEGLLESTTAAPPPGPLTAPGTLDADASDGADDGKAKSQPRKRKGKKKAK